MLRVAGRDTAVEVERQLVVLQVGMNHMVLSAAFASSYKAFHPAKAPSVTPMALADLLGGLWTKLKRIVEVPLQIHFHS